MTKQIRTAVLLAAAALAWQGCSSREDGDRTADVTSDTVGGGMTGGDTGSSMGATPGMVGRDSANASGTDSMRDTSRWGTSDTSRNRTGQTRPSGQVGAAGADTTSSYGATPSTKKSRKTKTDSSISQDSISQDSPAATPSPSPSGSDSVQQSMPSSGGVTGSDSLSAGGDSSQLSSSLSQQPGGESLQVGATDSAGVDSAGQQALQQQDDWTTRVGGNDSAAASVSGDSATLGFQSDSSMQDSMQGDSLNRSSYGVTTRPTDSAAAELNAYGQNPSVSIAGSDKCKDMGGQAMGQEPGNEQAEGNEGRVPRDIAQDTAAARQEEKTRDSTHAAERAEAGGVVDSSLAVGGDTSAMQADTTGVQGDTSYAGLPNESRDSLQGNQPRVDTTQLGQQGGDTTQQGGDTTGQFGATPARVTSAARAFVRTVAASDKAEIKIACLALQKSTNADVKAFAQRLVDDHSRSSEQLKSTVQPSGIQVTDEISTEGRASVERLSQLSGAEFDRAFADHMVKDHEKAISEFEQASTSLEDPGLKAFAQQTLPTLQEHLQTARDLQQKVGAQGNGQ